MAFADLDKPLTWREANPVLRTFLQRFGLRADPTFYVYHQPYRPYVRDHDEPHLRRSER